MNCRHCPCPIGQDGDWWYHDCSHMLHEHPAEPDWRIGSQEGDHMSERVTCATLDEAKALAQRLQDVLDESDAVSEAVERIVAACEDKRSDVMNHLDLEAVESKGALALAGMEVGISEVLALLRSRDWSKGEGNENS